MNDIEKFIRAVTDYNDIIWVCSEGQLKCTKKWDETDRKAFWKINGIECFMAINIPEDSIKHFIPGFAYLDYSDMHNNKPKLLLDCKEAFLCERENKIGEVKYLIKEIEMIDNVVNVEREIEEKYYRENF